ncbi:hypothetical protein [Rubripirellula obstinata]|nr:hypothetical protein [Rubripirellula obstinata]
MNTSKDSVMVAVPSTVNLPSGADGDRWAIFLARLMLLTAQTPERRHQGHLIGMHRSELKRMLGRTYRNRINDMRDAGVIDINDRYCSGATEAFPNASAFPKSYRLTTAHRHGAASLHCLETKPAQKIASIIREIDPKNLGEAGQHFHGLFDRFSISPMAIAGETDHWTAWTIARWVNGDDFAQRCEYRRYHSLSTQTPRSIRNHLRADGDSLAVIDVSACQPVLLAFAVAHQLTPVRTTNGEPLLPYVARFSGGELWRNKVPVDLRRWLDLSESREIYPHFREAVLAMNGPVNAQITLDDGRCITIDLRELPETSFKRATLIPLFDTAEATVRSPLFQIMQRDFPTVSAYVLKTKLQRHQDTACLLQHLESLLMIDGCGEYLAKHHPDEPVQPIHDALMVRPAFADDAAHIIRDQFNRIGLNPRVKIDTFSTAA